jgi:ribosome biogenesis GTPase
MNKNSDLGYNEFFESARKELGSGDFSVARVVSEQKGLYKVKNKDGEYLAKIRGKQMFDASSREDYPAVGDWVVITELENKQAVIDKKLPRKTAIKRKASDRDEVQIIATNIDVAFVVESVNRDYNLNRFERYFSIINDGGIKPVIVLNKIDLISKEELKEKIVQIENRFKNIDIILTSVKDSQGISELKKYIEKGKTYCFLGSSGVGKSSLINKLRGKNIIKTENIGDYSGRGKHATTNREMYFLKNGAIVIDNPGIREVGLADVETGVNDLFDEITDLAKECRYSNCTHIHEPDCMVLLALRKGELDKEKYDNYISLKKESDHYNMTRVEKKEKNRRFGKFMKKAKKDFKVYKNKNY